MYFNTKIDFEQNKGLEFGMEGVFHMPVKESFSMSVCEKVKYNIFFNRLYKFLILLVCLQENSLGKYNLRCCYTLQNVHSIRKEKKGGGMQKYQVNSFIIRLNLG